MCQLSNSAHLNPAATIVEQIADYGDDGDDVVLLKENFGYMGDTFTQLFRTEKTALYERNTPKGFPQWEVIRIRKREPYERFGKKYTAKEHYPSSKTWGKSGWTFNDFHEAKEHFEQLP
jgi:hypothetical protein